MHSSTQQTRFGRELLNVRGSRGVKTVIPFYLSLRQRLKFKPWDIKLAYVKGFDVENLLWIQVYGIINLAHNSAFSCRLREKVKWIKHQTL